jgi:hypothetical protein
MRFISAGVVVASLFVASLANASEPKTEGGKGGPTPSAAPVSEGTNGAESGTATRSTETSQDGEDERNPDKINAFAPSYKPWEVGMSFETHRLIYQNDLAGGDAVGGSPDSGAGQNKGVNDWEVYLRYDITKHDRISVRAFVFERFLVDDGETGVRFDDMLFAYTHSIPLPKKFNLDLGFSLTAPTSLDSRLAGTITSPRFSVSIDRRFGPLSLDYRMSAQYDIQTESTYGGFTGQDGGAPTSVFHVSMIGDAELHMPFYEPLSLGVGVFNGYVWLHNVSGQLPASCDPTFCGNQPVQQSYGGEAFVRWLMPTVYGFKPDLTVAYAMGDPAVGYTSLLHEGVGHVYLGYREQASAYLNLSVRY